MYILLYNRFYYRVKIYCCWFIGFNTNFKRTNIEIDHRSLYKWLLNEWNALKHLIIHIAVSLIVDTFSIAHQFRWRDNSNHEINLECHCSLHNRSSTLCISSLQLIRVLENHLTTFHNLVKVYWMNYWN